MVQRWEVQRLNGWLTFAETSEALGVTPAAVDFMVFNAGQFRLEDIRQVGGRPTYLLREAAVARMRQAREQAHADAAARPGRGGVAERAFRMRVREWAWVNGYPDLKRTAPLRPDVIEAYRQAHPDG